MELNGSMLNTTKYKHGFQVNVNPTSNGNELYYIIVQMFGYYSISNGKAHY
jgi:hypothetical protein